VAISEGVHDENNTTVAEKFTKGETDSFGHVQLSGTVRWETICVFYLKRVLKNSIKKKILEHVQIH
jgi:hypothetical protein